MKAMNVSKKQNARQRRILIASLVIALTLVIGSTFAWFTSTDSVTNRLTASADYGVSITETFTPPEDWVPGQAVSKKVGAVNTGNISAFVRLTLSNSLTVSYESTTDKTNVNFSNTTSSDKIAYSGNVVDPVASIKLVKLDTSNDKNEVLAVQAGGYLVAAYTESTNNGTTIYSPISYTDNSNATITVKLGKVGTKYNTYDDSGNFNSTSAAPAAGYYIYRNTYDETKYKWTYDGFYFDGIDYWKIEVTADPEPTYNSGDEVTDGDGTTTVADGIADDAKFTVSFVTKETTKTVNPTFEYEAAKDGNGDGSYATPHSVDEHPARIVATYDKGTSSDTKDDIIIYINLNTDAVNTNAGDNWTYGGMNSSKDEAYFFLNQLLEPGKTSSNLVESVELSQYIQEKAYVDLTYDLNIGLYSVQAVYEAGDDGTTKVDAANSAESAKTLYTNSANNGSYNATGTDMVNEVKITPMTGEAATVEWTK